MPTRTFVNWEKPCLKEVARLLSDEHTNEQILDLSNLVLICPGTRAGRRLLELLVFEAEARELSFVPPVFATPGSLPELLYLSENTIANNLERYLAWMRAFEQLSDTEKAVLSSTLIKKNSLDTSLIFAKQIDKIYRDIAAENLDFEKVAAACQNIQDFGEENRWLILNTVYKNFKKILIEHKLVDKYSARKKALSQEELVFDKHLVLIACSDLNQTVKEFLKKINNLSYIIHAPESFADYFDDFACVISEKWKSELVKIPQEKIFIEDKIPNQAEKVLELISENAQGKTFEDVSCGLMDKSLSPFLVEKLGRFGIPVREASGFSVSLTPPVDFLIKISTFINSKSFIDYAALIRQQDVYQFLNIELDDSIEILKVLDAYHSKYLQAELIGEFFGDNELTHDFRQIFEALGKLTNSLPKKKQNPNEWVENTQNLFRLLYANHSPDPRSQEALLFIGRGFKSLAEFFPQFQQSLTFSEFVSLLLSEVETASLPPEGETEAVELLGWLELQLDDAEFMVCTGMNEGLIPESIVSDAFLPDCLRKELGLLDNERRLQRDKYILATLLNSKEKLIFLASRFDIKGDPLLVSRLLLSTDIEDLAKRINDFYSETAVSKSIEFTNQGSEFFPQEPAKLEEPPSSISVTGFKTYLSCPYRYYLKHILGLEELNDSDLELPGKNFGIAAHEVLKDFGRSEVKDSSDASLISEFLNIKLSEYWTKNFGSSAHAAVYIQKEQLRERLNAFAVQQSVRAKQGWIIKYTEKAIKNVFIETEFGNLEIKGQIDRIDWNEKLNTWAIFDYKTTEIGSNPKNAHYLTKKEEWKDLQLPAYHYSLLKIIPEIENLTLGYINLAAGDKAGFVI
ncbi:MAG: PD-(D/E)XK nuclease family protein [Bdellovibrionales bacterium]|nr:PD-(D/E)XK nuclease family protein [Bdellovibrionales bacterium]